MVFPVLVVPALVGSSCVRVQELVVSTKEVVRAGEEVEQRTTDSRLKPDVSGDVLLLQLSLLNMNLISCFLICL